MVVVIVVVVSIGVVVAAVVVVAVVVVAVKVDVVLADVVIGKEHVGGLRDRALAGHVARGHGALLIAHLGDIDVLGLPGCARSLKLNGFDWVLRRRFADIPVSRRDIMTMGAGGLLMEIPSRPLPRAFASPKDPNARGDEGTSESGSTKIAALVLAAGESRRMGTINKLLVE